MTGLLSSLAWALVLLEMLIMISPFALYYYGAYGPILGALRASAWTAWLPAFFLPHLVSFAGFPDLVRIGFWVFVAGLVAFGICAAQLYWVKLRTKAVAKTGLYARIRHPQYLCLGVAGLGLLAAWPRFVILVFYVLMLFAYYALARDEERRMETAFGDSYRTYRTRSWMFLPGEPGGRLFALFARRPASRRTVLVVAPLVLAIALGAAFSLRALSVRAVPTHFSRDARLAMVLLSTRDDSRLLALLDRALTDAAVTARLVHLPGAVAQVAEDENKLHHLLIDLGMPPRAAKHVASDGEAMVVSRALSPRGDPIGMDLLAPATWLVPSFLVHTGPGARGLEVIDLSPDDFRGNRAAPLF